MDTRAKIVDLARAEEAARQARDAGKSVKLVSGHFDPLLAAHARRLREIAGEDAALFVVIHEPERPILPARARAELVAALGVVDYVLLAEALASEDSFGRLRPDAVYREEAADRRRTLGLMLHVQNRHR
jgi:bifunctional ADP-heptose synthase (sugar kinase/adenylyltransferase)